MHTANKENLLNYLLPSFCTLERNRLPVFKEITERKNKEIVLGESTNIKSTISTESLLLREKTIPTPEELESATRTIQIHTLPELLSTTISEVTKLFGLQPTAKGIDTLEYHFDDIRDAISFIKQSEQLLSGVEFSYVQSEDEVIGIRCKGSEELLLRVMKKLGDLMRVKRVDAETMLFWYYDHKVYERGTKLFDKLMLKKSLFRPKGETRLRRRISRFRRGEPLEINNAERYSGIKKRNNVQQEDFIINLDTVISGKDTRTTIMIKNIPNKYNQKMLLDTVNARHKNTYDFFYLPIDFKNKCNVGYAFINFKHAFFLVAFYNEFNGKKWKRFNSEKICSITYGRVQGLKALIEHFRTSSVMIQTDPRLKPLILDN